MITINKVNKYFNKKRIHAIDNTSLTLEDSGLVALLGPSGCGKTTLLNAIGGLDKVNKGSIYINGKKITSKFICKVDKIRNNNIGYIFQDYKLINNYSVFDNVAIVLKMLGIKDKKEIKERVEYVLDKVGMLRYKRRPASMLSGGERQRVGIARAIIKNPDIILADEPTGNLDSKNSLEIMNIIKSISKTKLVILVTHEVNLAKFYASRIIEIQDGKVINDYENNHNNDLDYYADNEFYLKDFTYHEEYSYDKIKFNVYSDDTTNTKVNIVIKNGNIYIQSNKDNVEVVDDHSSISFINDHYKKINKNDIDKYEFDLSKLEITKKKYSSIMNMFQIIKYGFTKIFDYNFIRKLLLGGFFAAAFMILLSASMCLRVFTVNDSDFVNYNKNYLMEENRKVKIEELDYIEKLESVKYVLPGNSLVSFNLEYNKYYQSSGRNLNITGSLSDISLISSKDLILGVIPKSVNEIVIDKAVYEKDVSLKTDLKNLGIFDISYLLNVELKINKLGNFKIVGISDSGSPCIYTDPSQFVNIIHLSDNGEHNYREYDFQDYKIFNYDLKKGRYPENDYETIVNVNREYEYELNKSIDYIKVNDKKLKVVGFYYSKDNLDSFLVNNNTIKFDNYNNSKGVMIVSNDKDKTIEELRSLNIELKDSYQTTKDRYVKEKRASFKSVIVASIIIISISVIEIFLIIRSSFLSRVKEIGIYRAIGVKKLDIYKMFYGEIFAITTVGSLTGIIFGYYVIKKLSETDFLNQLLMIDCRVVIICTIFVYVFNAVVGLIPVFNVNKKRPAEILSRTDLD